jgi:hypothetical protein
VTHDEERCTSARCLHGYARAKEKLGSGLDGAHAQAFVGGGSGDAAQLGAKRHGCGYCGGLATAQRQLAWTGHSGNRRVRRMQR